MPACGATATASLLLKAPFSVWFPAETGLSSWFPKQAASFEQSAKSPGYEVPAQAAAGTAEWLCSFKLLMPFAEKKASRAPAWHFWWCGVKYEAAAGTAGGGWGAGKRDRGSVLSNGEKAHWKRPRYRLEKSRDAGESRCGCRRLALRALLVTFFRHPSFLMIFLGARCNVTLPKSPTGHALQTKRNVLLALPPRPRCSNLTDRVEVWASRQLHFSPLVWFTSVPCPFPTLVPRELQNEQTTERANTSCPVLKPLVVMEGKQCCRPGSAEWMSAKRLLQSLKISLLLRGTGMKVWYGIIKPIIPILWD